MKIYVVGYSVTTFYDTLVKATSAKAAVKKVAEVIGEPLELEEVREIKRGSNKRT